MEPRGPVEVQSSGFDCSLEALATKELPTHLRSKSLRGSRTGKYCQPTPLRTDHGEATMW